MKLNHLAITTADVEALGAFYAQLMGLSELSRHHDEQGLRSIWLQLDVGILMVERGPPHQEGGWRLPAFHIPSSERGTWRSRLEALGAGPVEQTGFTLYGRDPDGNRVAFSCYPEPAPEPL